MRDSTSVDFPFPGTVRYYTVPWLQLLIVLVSVAPVGRIRLSSAHGAVIRIHAFDFPGSGDPVAETFFKVDLTFPRD